MLGALWHRARLYRRELTLISALSLGGSLASLAIPWLAGNFLVGVLGDRAIDLRGTLALLVVALVSMTGLNIAVTILSELASGRILAGLRREAYNHVQAMPLGFFDQSRGGDLLALMTYEVANLSRFLTSTLANVPSMLMTAAGASVLLIVIDPMIGLIVPVLVPLVYVLFKLFGRRLRNAARRVRHAEANLLTIVESDLEIIPAIKGFAEEEKYREHYAQAVERARVFSLAQARLAAFPGPTLALAAALAAIAILVVGSTQIDTGGRTPGEVFTFLLYAALLTRPIGGLADTYGALQIARGTLARLEDVLTRPVEEGYAATVRISRAHGAISFEQVGFAYPGRPPVLDGFDLSIAPGEVVALTGKNGVGKSTIVRLLLRFYDCDKGRITLDGVDIADLQVQDLRRQFGYVPQQALLFNGTIAENITLGASPSDPRLLDRAIELAQASDLIANLPDGLATQIGDNGVRLSGGQRQRIALARALLRDPPIYILDEATSMYDLNSEAAFVENCIKALNDRTVIIITHRPASLALADRIIDVDTLLGSRPQKLPD